MAKRKSTKKAGYFRQNWKLMTLLLGPLTLFLVGIVLMVLYDTSYSFRQSWDKWWNDLLHGAPSTTTGVGAPIVPQVASYEKAKVAVCKSMPNAYVRENMDAPNPIELEAAIGVESGATEKTIHNRCVDFAKTVAKMETVSNQRHHAYLCPGTRVRLGKGFGFIPNPEGDGIMIASSDPKVEQVTIPIAPGRQAFYKDWQFYNAGDGCYIVGYSTRRTRALEVYNE